MKGEKLSIPYTGPSMNPTFRAGDLLEVVPCEVSELGRGDVIVFIPPGGSRKVTHRIVSAGPEGILTRGDRNNRVDDYLLKQENITGCVRKIIRNGKRRAVYGGYPGAACALCARLTVRLLRITSLLLHHPYRFLAGFSAFSRLPYVRSRIKVLRFKRGEAEEFHAVFGSRLIARLLPGQKEWKFKKPFRLFVDERLLNDKITP